MLAELIEDHEKAANVYRRQQMPAKEVHRLLQVVKPEDGVKIRLQELCLRHGTPAANQYVLYELWPLFKPVQADLGCLRARLAQICRAMHPIVGAKPTECGTVW